MWLFKDNSCGYCRTKGEVIQEQRVWLFKERVWLFKDRVWLFRDEGCGYSGTKGVVIQSKGVVILRQVTSRGASTEGLISDT